MIETQKSEEETVVVPLTERVAAVMQSDPQLFVDRVYVGFHRQGVDIAMYSTPWDVVHEMASLLGLSTDPIHACFLSGPEDSVLVRFGVGYLTFGIRIDWCVDVDDARLILGSRLSELLLDE
jgi:hypothetical protein